MLKQRSLLPSFGVYSPAGRSYGTYLLRMPTVGQTYEQALLAYHALGYASSSINPSSFTYYAMGVEKFESTEKFYRDNWCNHLKLNRVNKPFTMGHVTSTLRWALYPFTRITPGNYAYPAQSDVELQHAADFGKVGDGLRAQAYWDMRPKFEGEISMLNFLFELKDFRGIAKTLTSPGNKNPLKKLADAFSGYKQSQKALMRDVQHIMSSPTKRLAEGHLTYSFALKPLISDVAEIIKQCHEMVEEAERKFGANGEGNTRHWSSRMDPVATWTSDTQSSTCVYRFGSRMQSTYTMTAKQRFTYTPRSKFNRFCTYWGLVPTAEAVWNALPLSFLADYFLTIGRSLNRMRTDPNVTNYSASEVVESVLTSYTSGRHIATHPTYNIGHMGIVVDKDYFPSISYDSPRLIDGYYCTIYKRVPNITPYYGPSLPVFRFPKTSQLTNMAALARCFI